MANKKSTARSFGILSGLTIIEKIISFVYQAFIASVLGASIITDSYFAASQLITFVDKTLFAGLTIALLNYYALKLAHDGRESAIIFLSNSFSWTVLISLAASMGTFLFARPMSLIIAPGFSEAARKLLIRDIHILSLIPLMVGCIAVTSTILRFESDFFAIGLKSLFLSSFGIICLMVISTTGAKETISLAYGQLAAIISYFAFILLRSRRYGTITLQKPEWNSDQKRVIELLLPLMVSNGISRISLMIDRIIASNTGTGGVSYITYSHTLYDVIHTLLIANLSTVLLTDFVSLVAEGKTEALKNKIEDAHTVIIYVLSIVTVISLFFSREIVEIIYLRGSFTDYAAEQTGRLLFCYAICFVFSATNNIYIRAYYAFGKNKETMYVSFVSIVVNITSSLILTRFIGLPGVAVGTIIGSVLMTILYSFGIRRMLPDYRGLLVPQKILHIGIIFLLSAVASIMIKAVIHNPLVSFILATTISGLLSAGALMILGDKYICMNWQNAVKLIRRYQKKQ